MGIPKTLWGLFFCFVSLIQMTFTRPANHRQLTFEEIAKSAKVTVNEVSLGLDTLGNVQVLDSHLLLGDNWALLAFSNSLFLHLMSEKRK